MIVLGICSFCGFLFPWDDSIYVYQLSQDNVVQKYGNHTYINLLFINILHYSDFSFAFSHSYLLIQHHISQLTLLNQKQEHHLYMKLCVVWSFVYFKYIKMIFILWCIIICIFYSTVHFLMIRFTIAWPLLTLTI